MNVTIRDVVKTYKRAGRSNVTALDLSGERIEVREGELVLVVGANGAGKTTLLHLVSGLLKPDRGKITVLGRDITSMAERELDEFRARAMGYLLQGQKLVEWLSALENVMAPMMFSKKSKARQRTRALSLMERFGLEKRMNHLPSELSGGERQKVAMARALANEPKVILADEPTAGLDKPTAVWLASELDALCREGGRCALVVTHEPELFSNASKKIELLRGLPVRGVAS